MKLCVMQGVSSRRISSVVYGETDLPFWMPIDSEQHALAVSYLLNYNVFAFVDKQPAYMHLHTEHYDCMYT